MASKKPKARDVLRISREESQRLLRKMDKHSAQNGVDKDKRSHKRSAYRASLEAEFQSPNGAITVFAVLARNLSPGGVSFLHGVFVHPKTECKVTLTTLDGEVVMVDGQVVNSRCISGRVHEVSVHFDTIIDVDLFLVDSDTVEGEEELDYDEIVRLTLELADLATGRVPPQQIRKKLPALVRAFC